MGRPPLPEHARMTDEALKVRGTPAHRAVWPEVASELRLTEVQLARLGIITLMRTIYHHEPHVIARAAERANRKLEELGLPPLTPEEYAGGLGLPESSFITVELTPEDKQALEEDRREAQHPLKAIAEKIGGFFR